MTFIAFVEGPLVWIAFLTFLLGSALRLLFFFTLSSKKDKPIYRFFSLKWMLLSIVRWLFPANVDLKKNPIFSILGYLFHICLLAVPLFYSAHVTLWEESRFKWKWWTMPDSWADWLTLTLLAIALFFHHPSNYPTQCPDYYHPFRLSVDRRLRLAFPDRVY